MGSWSNQEPIFIDSEIDLGGDFNAHRTARAYNLALPPIYKKYGGQYLALQPASRVEVAEGSAENRSIVIAKFPSKQAAWGFWKSPEYEAAKQLRAGKGTFFVTVLDGMPDS